MAGNENFLQNSSQTAGVNPLNEEQKIQEILQEQQKLHPAPKKKYYRRRKPKAAN